MSEPAPERYVPPREPTPQQASSNALFGLGLFAISLLLFGGTIAVAFVYIALD